MAPPPVERITPPGPLPPPIIGVDPASAPGIPQPVVVPGGQSLPPSLPAGSTFTSPGWGWLPPPQVGMGENEPFPTLAVNYPGVMSPWPTTQPPLLNQPVYATGSATAPTAASLFPDFSAPGPFQPIIMNATAQPPPLPAWPNPPPPNMPITPGLQPIILDGWGLGAGPGGEGNAAIFPPPTPPPSPWTPPAIETDETESEYIARCEADAASAGVDPGDATTACQSFWDEEQIVSAAVTMGAPTPPPAPPSKPKRRKRK